MMAGADGRFPEMEVKLKGVRAKINPSSGLYSIRFHIFNGARGWLI
jgi:hypothetical protein